MPRWLLLIPGHGAWLLSRVWDVARRCYNCPYYSRITCTGKFFFLCFNFFFNGSKTLLNSIVTIVNIFFLLMINLCIFIWMNLSCTVNDSKKKYCFYFKYYTMDEKLWIVFFFIAHLFFKFSFVYLFIYINLFIGSYSKISALNKYFYS